MRIGDSCAKNVTSNSFRTTMADIDYGSKSGCGRISRPNLEEWHDRRESLPAGRGAVGQRRAGAGGGAQRAHDRDPALGGRAIAAGAASAAAARERVARAVVRSG